MKTRVLFVDDEPNVLDGLRRMLRGMRHEWQMSFATDGYSALEMLDGQPYDVVVSDMRMPGMDGVQLLTEIKSRHPNIVRIVLSGQSDRDLILKSVRPSHQYLSKPCDPETLKSSIARAMRLRMLLEDDSLRQTVSGMESLPSLPSLYVELMEELESPDGSILRVGQIISQDMSMTAKILQLVNSPYFGLCRNISSPAQAASLLGLETIKALVLSVQIFSQFTLTNLPGSFLDRLWSHSMTTGLFAKAIAKAESQEQTVIDDSFMAGLLHDVGKLVLAENSPEQYAKVVTAAREHGMEMWSAEFEALGTTHAEVGAYLLGLWGLPQAIVEALAFHHRPREGVTTQFSPLTAVHAANGLDHVQLPMDQRKLAIAVDGDYLEELALSERLQLWGEACQQAASDGKT